jgi:hypothetical protein
MIGVSFIGLAVRCNYARACACARVTYGYKDHHRHHRLQVRKHNILSNLEISDDQPGICGEHAGMPHQCHSEKESINSLALETGDLVPRLVLTAPLRQIHGTSAPRPTFPRVIYGLVRA